MNNKIILKGGFIPTNMTSKKDIEKAVKEVESFNNYSLDKFIKVLSNIKK